MEHYQKKPKLILTCGIIGIIGAAVTIICDFILLGRPISAQEFLKLGTESMNYVSEWRITFGTFFGVVVLPFQIAGIITVYFGLKPENSVISFIVSLLLTHALIMGVAFHAAYAFIGSGWKMLHNVGLDNNFAVEMIEKFNMYWRIIVIFTLIEIIVGSLLFAYIILKKKTYYPKWMAAFNPLTLLGAMYLVMFRLPSPIGGFIGPAYLNISTLIFIILSTFTVYKAISKNYQVNID